MTVLNNQLDYALSSISWACIFKTSMNVRSTNSTTLQDYFDTESVKFKGCLLKSGIFLRKLQIGITDCMETTLMCIQVWRTSEQNESQTKVSCLQHLLKAVPMEECKNRANAHIWWWGMMVPKHAHIYSFLVLRLFLNLSKPEGGFCSVNIVQSPLNPWAFLYQQHPPEQSWKCYIIPMIWPTGCGDRYLKNITVMLITLKSLNSVKKEEKNVEKENYLYTICLYIKYCAVYVYYLNFHHQKHFNRLILTKNGI